MAPGATTSNMDYNISFVTVRQVRAEGASELIEVRFKDCGVKNSDRGGIEIPLI